MWLDKGQQFKRKNSHRHYRYFQRQSQYHKLFVLVLQIMIDNSFIFQFPFRPELWNSPTL